MSQEVYYRPPSEADSFIVRVMKGCPHNKCTFCNMFKDVTCTVVPLAEVLEGLEKDAAELGPEYVGLVDSIYLEGGDPLAIRTGHLLEIMAHARKLFPSLSRFACYATARQIARKPAEELHALAQAGLERVFVGLESGSDAILERVKKGCTSADILNSGLALARAGIEMDVSMMLGIGGKDDSSIHAVKTAQLINAIQPQCVRIRTFIPKLGTGLGDSYLSGEFALPGPHDILRELRLLVLETTARTRLLSEHWSNFVMFDAWMPGARSSLLEHIARYLALPETLFREATIGSSRS